VVILPKYEAENYSAEKEFFNDPWSEISSQLFLGATYQNGGKITY
jgi:hypothetical protein